MYGLAQAQITEAIKHTGSKNILLVKYLNFYFMYLQFTESVVGILDGISDWPEEVVQEQSSAYVYNNHP